MRTRASVRAVTAMLVGLVVSGGTAGGPPAIAFAAQPGRVLTVSVIASRINLTARDVPLADVLAAIGRQAGVRMVLTGDLSIPVTETLVNAPLDDAIQRLSRWQSIVLIYEASTEGMGGRVLTEAWVTRSSPERAQASSEGAKPEARDVPRNDVRLPARWEQFARTLIAFKDADPETRRRKIEDLVRAQGEEAIVVSLREVATRNPDPRTRRSAIQVLASMGSPAALTAVQAALGDAHAGVRSEAFTALRRQGARSREGSVD